MNEEAYIICGKSIGKLDEVNCHIYTQNVTYPWTVMSDNRVSSCIHHCDACAYIFRNLVEVWLHGKDSAAIGGSPQLTKSNNQEDRLVCCDKLGTSFLEYSVNLQSCLRQSCT